MSQKLSALPVGALIKETGTLYYGKPIVWKVADKNHTGYPAGSVTLITDKIICLKAFDAKEAGNADNSRANFGNNRYRTSNLRQWLNSGGVANAWWTAQNLTDGTANTNNKDAKPAQANTNNYNGYDTEAGFLANFSASLRAALMDTTLTVAKNTVTDGGSLETVTDKIFFASNTEVGLANQNGIAEGSKLAIFSDNNSRIGMPTAEAAANSNYTNSDFKVGAGWYWWLRTPNTSHSYDACYVNTGGALHDTLAYYGYVGVRPLCNLSSDIWVSDSTDLDGAYTITWTQPPTAPDGITAPGTIVGGTIANISWGASTDSDGSIGGYILERAYNGGSFSQVYKGINRSFSDLITFGWNTVQYRVKAYDNENAESGYTSTTVLTVVNSNPPVINGSDGNLGAKTGAFNQTYTVTNPNAGITKTLTVVEKIDGKQKRSFTATSGATNTFSVTAAEWLEALNGTHTLTVTATDNYGGVAVRTYTFSKNQTELEVTLTAPLAADAAVTKGIMSVTRQIPSGAVFSVEVCNNGFDASPTWEDVTNAVVSGSKFFLSNKTKTAAKWGFNIRVMVKRLSGVGDCYVSGLGGNFE